jgi:eukaryotic-like serine/threonine-protein kinase
VSLKNGDIVAGRYEILERIADGGMSTVYRARRKTDGVIVALKILRDQYASDHEFIERFTREARAAEGLQHPNIVPVYESGRDGELYYIAMEYVRGMDLKDHLRRLGRLEAGDAERIARAVCDALDYAHRQGIVHRDIKPQNILIAIDGTVKVADFGIARALSSLTITQPGTMLGTVQYLSPEQARGAPVGRTSDIYALGVVLYEMLTGRVPFEGDTPITIALKHIHDPTPRARAIQADVPLRLEGVIVKAMAKRGDARYRSAREMAADLNGETELWKEALAQDDGGTRSFALSDEDATVVRPRVSGLRGTAMVAGAIVIALWAGWQAVNAYLTVPEVEMPGLVGRPLREAQQLAGRAGIEVDVGDRVSSTDFPVDVVVSQDQPPGKRLKRGRHVAVTVSKGARLVTVPNVVSRSVREAQVAIDSAGLKPGALKDGYDEEVKAGIVMRQYPAAGENVPADTAVTLVISRGPPLVEMPSLVGVSLERARKLLDDRGLVATDVRTVGTAEVEPGVVLDQSPAAAARIRQGTRIMLTVSARPGEESAPPQAPVITAEPQPTETPARADPTPRPTVRPTPAPRTTGEGPAVRPSPRGTSVPSGVGRRTRVQVVVPEGGMQEVKIIVIDETGVHTIYQGMHAPGERVEQTVRSQGYTIIQLYVNNKLVQEVRP